jgi:GDP-L-fucose synthase
MTGSLETSNDAYAVAKIAGIKMCQDFNKQYGTNYISAMPTNLYGPNDNYDLDNSHVLPALIRKFHEAKKENLESVEIWGTGSPMREFLHVDDLSEACIFLMNNYDSSEIINVGTGKDITIKDLANLIKEIVGFDGYINFNSEMPDGTPRKLLDVSKIKEIGWSASIKLSDGITNTYKIYEEKNSN